MNLLNKMTNSEKNLLLSKDFKELWEYLWGNNIGIQYRSEEKISLEKFKELKNGINISNEFYTLESLINESNYKFCYE